jgi:cysteinyl-tRNA synthetase
MDALGIERPEHLPRATEHIPEMVTLIEQLAAKDIAYQAEDGSWYFRIARGCGLRQAVEEGFRGD